MSLSSFQVAKSMRALYAGLEGKRGGARARTHQNELPCACEFYTHAHAGTPLAGERITSREPLEIGQNIGDFAIFGRADHKRGRHGEANQDFSFRTATILSAAS